MARARSRVEDHHAEWLSLVETSGPFLTIPTLKRTLPDGLDGVPPALADLRIAYAEWQENPDLQNRWVKWVLEELLELHDAVTEATEADPSHWVAEHDVTLRPTFVVRDRSREASPAVLLVHAVPGGTSLTRPAGGDAWSASPIDRAVELARASHVPLALVTDGARWTLVWARVGQTTGTCTWQAHLWLEEQITLRAFATLLGGRRFFNVPVEEGLAELLQESASKQQEVADQLGSQVRRAVELLIATLDREDGDRHGELLQDLEGAEVYRGAVTVMMRLVFLFVAEERRLLPIDDPRYAETLAASTLRSQLQERADRDSEDPLERSTAAWHRVLALFRAVHSGIEHDALRLPAYGGGLFDPDRYPFLEGRAPDSDWHTSEARPLPVDDRTMLHLLDALQTLEQGGARVLLSYQALDVEQIGHVYEGLLDHTAVRLSDSALALSGKHEPEIALGELGSWAAAGEDALVDRLAKETGKSASAVRKALEAPLADEARSRLRAACGNDDALVERVAPYHALLRDDLRGDPLVFLAGALFVTQALDRRASGTYYTPRQLAEEVVRHALDPVAYDPGPAQEPDPANWQLKTADQLLDLKVADIAMGSGAFLVAACRYLAARVQEAWLAENMPPGLDTVEELMPRRRDPLPADPIERDALAHRLVSERCLYGVDKNPMAVEMAKLSLWLITLAKDRPFSFVDHALRVGDSLLGITGVEQLRVAHLDPNWPRQSTFDLGFDEIANAVERASSLRRDIEAFVVRDIPDAERKSQLLAEADGALDDARLLGDLVVGAAVAQRDDADPLAATEVAGNGRRMLDHLGDPSERLLARTQLRALADDWLVELRRAVGQVVEVEWDDRDPFHWALEFAEVFAHGGFDAIVGNPPFQGGKKISGALGSHYRDYLVEWLAGGVRGNADLVAYFYLRALSLLRHDGSFGLIATNMISQGDTRQVALDRINEEGHSIYRANPDQQWPGDASIEIATVWVSRRAWHGSRWINGTLVPKITSDLSAASRVTGAPNRLAAHRNLSFQGTVVVGMGFVLSPDEAEEMLSTDERNVDVIRPYIVGEDLNNRPDGSASRWVIDFRDWPEERAQEYAAPFARVAQLVQPVRAKVRRDAHRLRWWQFGDKRPALYKAVGDLDRCIAITLASKVLQPRFVPTGIVYAHKLGVFALDDDAHFGFLASGFHLWWAAKWTMRGTPPTYSPEDAFETLPQPVLNESVARLGRELDQLRQSVMLARGEGLAKTYSRVHNPDERSGDIARLRDVHARLDEAILAAYGWHELELDHDFHQTKLGTRFTFMPASGQEVVDRLLELNRERYADEVRRGLHSKPKRAGKRKPVAEGAMTLGLDGV